MKTLLNSFQLNCHLLGFDPHIQKFESNFIHSEFNSHSAEIYNATQLGEAKVKLF